MILLLARLLGRSPYLLRCPQPLCVPCCSAGQQPGQDPPAVMLGEQAVFDAVIFRPNMAFLEFDQPESIPKAVVIDIAAWG